MSLGQALAQAVSGQDNLAAVRSGGNLLADGGPFGHEDKGRYAHKLSSMSYALGMVAGRCRHNTTWTEAVAAFRQLVVSSTEFERAGSLEILQFEINPGLESAAEVIGIDQRGFKCYTLQNLCCLIDLFNTGHGCNPQR